MKIFFHHHLFIYICVCVRARKEMLFVIVKPSFFYVEFANAQAFVISKCVNPNLDGRYDLQSGEVNGKPFYYCKSKKKYLYFPDHSFHYWSIHSTSGQKDVEENGPRVDAYFRNYSLNPKLSSGGLWEVWNQDNSKHEDDSKLQITGFSKIFIFV